jgi:sialidase-1
MKIVFAVFLALVACPLMVQSAEPAPTAPAPAPSLPNDPRIFRTTIRKKGGDGVHTYRIPGLATTARGTLVAVFDLRHKGKGDLPGDIDVGALRSTDDGATWGAMQRVLDFDAQVPGSRGNGVGDPAVLVDRQSGTVFVAALWSHGARAWNGSGPGMTPEETGQLVIARSTDDGVTWSKPERITPQVKDPAWRICFNGPGNGIQLRDGTLVFSAQFKDAGNVPHSCFIASSDHGATWKISPAAIPGKPPTSESAIAELADGSLLLSMRNEARTGQRAWARWKWKGNVLDGQWSEPWAAVTDPTCMASLLRYPQGPLLLSNPNHAKQREALTIRTSTDDGRTWSVGKLLDPGVAMYSCMTVLRDGRIGILYETGDTDGLVFARFPLDWVLGK